MIQVIDPGITGSQLVGETLGQGVAQAGQQSLGIMLDQFQKQQKNKQIADILGFGQNQDNSKGGEINASRITTQSAQPGRGLNLTPEKVAAISTLDPQLGQVYSQLYQTQEKSHEKQRAFETERSNKYLEKTSDLATNLPERRIAIDSAKAAIKSGQMTPFGGDFVADILNLPQLRTTSGAQLATAAKTNLIGSLSQITGGRPNQFIEQQINNAFAKAGQSKEANLSQLDIIEAKLDLDERLAQLTDQLADEYRSSLGYVPESIDRDVRKLIKPYADQRMKELAYDLRENIENEIGASDLKKFKNVPNGTPLTLKTAKLLLDKYGDKAEEVALKLGYEIPDEEIYSRKK